VLNKEDETNSSLLTHQYLITENAKITKKKTNQEQFINDASPKFW